MYQFISYYIAWCVANEMCEDIFSTHKAVAGGSRTSSTKTADYLIRIIRNGHPVDLFDAPRAIKRWNQIKKEILFIIIK